MSSQDIDEVWSNESLLLSLSRLSISRSPGSGSGQVRAVSSPLQTTSQGQCGQTPGQGGHTPGQDGHTQGQSTLGKSIENVKTIHPVGTEMKKPGEKTN